MKVLKFRDRISSISLEFTKSNDVPVAVVTMYKGSKFSLYPITHKAYENLCQAIHDGYEFEISVKKVEE